jgi:hypothetical protein
MCVVSFPSLPAISQHNLNPGLKLANLGIIEKVASLCRIKESCSGVDLVALVCQLWRKLHRQLALVEK